MHNLNEHYIFSQEELNELPVNFRFFKQLETESIDELYLGFRFSQSEQHYSKSFLNYILYKPVSNILFHDIVNDFGTHL